MKHNNYNIKSKHIEKPIEKMILKAYPDYKKGDWVLWIIPDMFCEYTVEEVIGSIKVIDGNDYEVNINYLTRTPYPNKSIYQMSMRSGRKRLYGIPLVFKTFEELCSIKKVQIRWDIFQIMYLKEDIPFDLKLTNCIVDYELDFVINKEDKNFRFFTVHSYEYMEVKEEDFDKNEFDNAIWSGGIINLDDEMKDESELVEFTDLLIDYHRTVSDWELKFMECMEKESKPQDLIKKYSPSNGSEAQWDVYWYKKKEQLIAQGVPDILPEPAFGFDY